MRIVLKIEYDGTDYCGWQVQPNGVTVQGVIEEAIKKLTGEKVSVIGSGRTDSGVHAAGQIAHFDITSEKIPPEKYACALNAFLPRDIKITESGEAEDGFHARFSAKRKTYRYSLYVSEYIRPLKDRYAVNVPFALDENKMNEACRYLAGRHDFRCFLAADSSVKDTVRVIYFAKVEKSGEDYTFTVCGNGFLYNIRYISSVADRGANSSYAPFLIMPVYFIKFISVCQAIFRVSIKFSDKIIRIRRITG